MGRLKQLKPMVGSLAPRLGRMTDDHGHSRVLEPWRKWYSLAAWSRLRLDILVRDGFECQTCHHIDPTGRHLVADHRIPHRGDRDLFWSDHNIQTLCKPCHDGSKQKQERASVQRGASPGRMSRPEWFRRSHVPVTLVCGPPGSGKSTWVRRMKGEADLVVCFDEISGRMFADGKPRAGRTLTPDQIADVLRVRNEKIADLMWARAADRWPRAWIIVSEPQASARQWWSDRLGAQVVVLETPEAECLRRIELDEASGDPRGPQARRSVAEWWRQYRPRDGDRRLGGLEGGS
ncbi:MAG: AAA family ATPase [Phenylobacterium sp.]|uniref:AAA family ATPase n=1 Tax=Phenylobacterium sp. TaxID=1871053 RepID=UPI0025F13543|nr:AAA family ATPase [Phenylobacterium sp.]MCA3727337.1 AAA family ATPase [Phenylobacterium sp.]MCA6243414.1 AAA family ATPase [Phenylobacterium sp.]MCA6278581.1 AAA family ATPase [Phenylobacterium sp.]MCA6294714.1 AAA family ATPase [Phenylobacterium sp.]